MEQKLTWLIALIVVGLGAYFLANLDDELGQAPEVPEVEDADEPDLPAVEMPKKQQDFRYRPQQNNAGNESTEIPAELGPENQLSGTISDPQGKGVVGAKITLFQYVYVKPARIGRVRVDHDKKILASTTTTTDGHYLFADLSQLNPFGAYYSLRIQTENFVEVLKDQIGPGLVVDATLEVGTTIVGTIRDAVTDVPVAGCLVDVSMKALGQTKHEYRRWRQRLKSDSKGVFRIPGTPSAKLTIFLEHPEYQWLHIKPEDDFWVPSEGNKVEFNFKLNKGFVLNGKVVDKTTGQPIAKCNVAMREYIIATRREVTGVFGKFSIRGLNQGRFEASLTAPGYTNQRLMLECNEEALAEERVFLMTPAGFAAGVVVDSAGDPIAGAEIFVAEGLNVFRKVRAKVESYSDGSGNYSVGNLDDQRTYRIAATAAGYSIAASGDFKATGGEYVDNIIIQLERGTTLQGIVQNEEGVPVEGALVSIEQPPYDECWFPPGSSLGQKSTLTVATDARGYWKLERLWAGPYEIAADHPNFVPLTPEKIRIEKSSKKIEKTFTLMRGLEISGIVSNQDGSPARGAVVSAAMDKFHQRKITVKTDAEGKYAFKRLKNRPYRVKAQTRQAIAKTQTEIPAGSKGIDFQLLAMGSVEGTVMEYGSSRPLERFKIKIGPLMDLPESSPDRVFSLNSRLAKKLMSSNESFVERTMVEPNGRFIVAGLEPGRYLVEVSAPDHVATRQVSVVVQPGSVTIMKTFALRSGARFQGKILDSAGRPVNPTHVSIRLVAAPNSTLETTLGPGGKEAFQRAVAPWEPKNIGLNPDGSFGIGGLPAGIIEVQMNSQFYCCPDWEKVTFGKDGIVQKTYNLQRAAKVIVHVTDTLGDKVQLPSAAVFDAEGNTAKVDGRRIAGRGDMNGKLEIPKLEPGQYTIEVKRFGYGFERLSIQVSEGEEQIHEVKIEKLN